MGVLKVNVGTVAVPDWRKVGCGGGGVAGLTFSDSFTRANSTTTLGSPWVTTVSSGGTIGSNPYSAVWGISSNQAYLVSGSSTTIPMALVDAGTGDIDMSVTFAVRSNSHQGGVAFRVAAATSVGWRVDWNGQLIDPTNTVRAAGTGLYADGDVCRVVANGTSITVYKNGVVTGSFTSSSQQTATYHGISVAESPILTATTFRWDNFSIAPATAPTTGRLKLWDGTQWLKECCDGDTGHPLKVWDGSAWQTVACMVPA